jgi:hypothetical protein
MILYCCTLRESDGKWKVKANKTAMRKSPNWRPRSGIHFSFVMKPQKNPLNLFLFEADSNTARLKALEIVEKSPFCKALLSVPYKSLEEQIQDIYPV